MSNDHQEMTDDDMEDEGQINTIAWRGMNLREQIKGKHTYRETTNQENTNTEKPTLA